MIPCFVTVIYFRKSVFAIKMAVKKLCAMCNRLFYCKSTLNRHVKVCPGERRQEKEKLMNYYTLKLHVTVKKSDHEIKSILQNAVVLLKINMQAEFQKVELVDRQVLIQTASLRKHYTEFNVF